MIRSLGLAFWTDLGSAVLGLPSPVDRQHRAGYSETMIRILAGPHAVPPAGRVLLGACVAAKRARHIYDRTWEVLRPMGFRRAHTIEPWPGVGLFLPFVGDGLAVVPQGFTPRVPRVPRSLALAGKALACRKAGLSLLVVAADWDDEVTGILTSGGVSVCSADRLEEAACRP
jgi:hypothetical protein